jgi:hypothetical protein
LKNRNKKIPKKSRPTPLTNKQIPTPTTSSPNYYVLLMSFNKFCTPLNEYNYNPLETLTYCLASQGSGSYPKQISAHSFIFKKIQKIPN